jgi:hypothetical protein
MSELSITAAIFGGVMILLYLPLVLFPEKAQEGIRRFPRSKWSGRVITAIVLIWCAWLLHNSNFFKTITERFGDPDIILCIFIPVSYFLIVNYMDELLAVRALGALMLLVPTPLLNAARWHESSLRLVITVMAYILVIKGIILVLSPFKFRKWAGIMIKNAETCRLCGVCGLLVSGFILYLACLVY